MADKQVPSVTHEEALSQSGQDTPYVMDGYGKTTKLEGTQTKKVYNVSFT